MTTAVTPSDQHTPMMQNHILVVINQMVTGDSLRIVTEKEGNTVLKELTPLESLQVIEMDEQTQPLYILVALSHY